MAYELVIPKVDTALRALLVANATLTAAIATKPTALGGGAAIYEDGKVPQGATLPYLTIGAWTQVPENSFAPDSTGYGYNCTCQIKAVGQTTETALMSVMSKVFAVVPQGQAITVSGYTHSWTDEFVLHPTLKEVVGGVTTLSVPAILRVYVS